MQIKVRVYVVPATRTALKKNDTLVAVAGFAIMMPCGEKPSPLTARQTGGVVQVPSWKVRVKPAFTVWPVPLERMLIWPATSFPATDETLAVDPHAALNPPTSPTTRADPWLALMRFTFVLPVMVGSEIAGLVSVLFVKVSVVVRATSVSVTVAGKVRMPAPATEMLEQKWFLR